MLLKLEANHQIYHYRVNTLHIVKYVIHGIDQLLAPNLSIIFLTYDSI